MKKILLILLFVPFMLSAQIPAPLVDLSEYHDDNRIKEMTDLNFTHMSEGGYLQPEIKVTVLDYSPPHGSMAFADSAAVISLTQNVWSKVTNGNNDLFTVVDGDDLTVVGDSITVTIAGDYAIWWGLSFIGGPSDQYHAAVYKNAVITPFEMHRKTSNADTGNMGLNGYLDNLAIGDDISFYIRNTGDSDDPTLVSSQVTIFMLHPR